METINFLKMLNTEDLEKIVGEKIKDANLYLSAFTHRSYLNEHRGFPLPHNERLEFLGDAVLELIATEHLYSSYPHPEGELTSFRSALVNYRRLSDIASRIGLEKFLRMSRGEAKDIGRARQVILANAIEALIGAIYLDLGYRAAAKFIELHILVELKKIIEEQEYLDPKSRLQEIIQERQSVTPTYKVVEESGPDHNKKFIVAAYIDHREIGRGSGSSKQEAEVSAAVDALQKI